jgi:hypothetical protein
MAQTIEQALHAAAQGLLYQSETDQPLEPFTWAEQGELTAEKVRALGGHSVDAKVEETTLDAFFEAPTAEKDWHGAAEKASVQKFRALVKLIKDRLQEIKVFRIGETEVTIHIVGRTPQGNWAGLTTTAVET